MYHQKESKVMDDRPAVQPLDDAALQKPLGELRRDVATLSRDVKELAADIARGPLPGHEDWLERMLAVKPEVRR